jgi:hypothetical protein
MSIEVFPEPVGPAQKCSSGYRTPLISTAKHTNNEINRAFLEFKLVLDLEAEASLRWGEGAIGCFRRPGEGSVANTNIVTVGV